MCVYVYLLGNWKIHVPVTPFLLASSVDDHAWLNPLLRFSTPGLVPYPQGLDVSHCLFVFLFQVW